MVSGSGGLPGNIGGECAESGHTVSQVYCSALPVGRRAKSPKLFLTLVGGGVFGNETCWILDAINISLEKFREVPLEVQVVSYGSLNSQVGAFCQKF